MRLTRELARVEQELEHDLSDGGEDQPRTYVDAAHAYQQTAAPDPFGASSLRTNNASGATVGGTSPSPSKGSVFNANAVSTTGKSPTSELEDFPSAPPSSSTVPIVPTPTASTFSKVGLGASTHPLWAFPQTTRRVLYTTNTGDARAVLSWGGKAARLAYDHKGPDVQARRTKEAGGFVMNNRANGAPLLFPSSAVPPSSTSPSQSASSYSNPKTFPSRIEEGCSDACETQPPPNVAFEMPFALAIAGRAIVLDPDGI